MVRVASDKPVRTKKVVCPKCAFELEFTGEDVATYRPRSFGDDPAPSEQYIKCPREKCGARVTVKWP